MYKVLIADDEVIIRQGIALLFDEIMGFEVVAMAEDGEIALEMAEEYQPELFLVDINMPFLNGLDMLEKIFAKNPDANVIIISGYDDFDYVQRALRMGVMDYIKKPIVEENFVEIMIKTKAILDEKYRKNQQIDWVYNQVKQNRDALVEKFLNKWINRRMCDFDIQKELDFLQLSIPNPYMITVSKFQKSVDISEKEKIEKHDRLLYFTCQNIAQEIYGKISNIISFWSESGELILISESADMDIWEMLQMKFAEEVEKYVNVHVMIDSVMGTDIKLLPEIVKEAENRLRMKNQYSLVVLQAMRYMEKEIDNPELSLQSVAVKLFISTNYLSRKFKQETGDTFVAYLTQMRVQRAKELLKNPELRICDISEMTGYSSQHYFSNAFKKLSGLSPAEYRKNILNGERNEK